MVLSGSVVYEELEQHCNSGRQAAVRITNRLAVSRRPSRTHFRLTLPVAQHPYRPCWFSSWVCFVRFLLTRCHWFEMGPVHKTNTTTNSHMNIISRIIANMYECFIHVWDFNTHDLIWTLRQSCQVLCISNFPIQRLREMKKWAGSKKQTLMADAKAQAQLPHLLNFQRTASEIFLFFGIF